MKRQKVDYTGQRIGQCEVLGPVPRKPEHYQRVWRLRCDCGEECEKVEAQLKRPSPTTRCRTCFARSVGDKNRRHGETGGYLFQLWENMKRRCYDENFNGYRNWGGRGIRVYGPWLKDYLAFATWVRENIGERPSPRYSLDRRDNDGDYVPGNLRWATAAQQQANRRPWRDDSPKRIEMRERAAQPFVGPRRPPGRPRTKR